jgi:hypothetical protein
MSDAAGAIMAALDPLLRADAGVIAAFGAAKVRLYDLPPQASAVSLFPYITLSDAHQVDQEYEAIDASETVAQLHVWSRTDPPGTAEVKRIAAAVKAATSNLDDLMLTGFRLIDALPLDTMYLTDPDGVTVHAVIRIQYSTDPI